MNHKKNRKTNRMRGGASCELATIREPGFSVSAKGNITGLSIPESSAIIYNPNCSNNSAGEAMVP